jgi:hypothetical protein
VYLQTTAGEISLIAPTPATKNRPVWALVIWKVLAVAAVIAVQVLGIVLDAEGTAEEHENHWWLYRSGDVPAQVPLFAVKVRPTETAFGSPSLDTVGTWVLDAAVCTTPADVVHQLRVDEDVTLAVTCLPSCAVVTEKVLALAPAISVQPAGAESAPVVAVSQASHW